MNANSTLALTIDSNRDLESLAKAYRPALTEKINKNVLYYCKEQLNCDINPNNYEIFINGIVVEIK